MKRHLSGSPARPPHIVARSVVRPVAPRRWQALRGIARRAKSLKRRLPQRDLLLRRLPPEAREVEAQTAIHTSYPVIMKRRPKKLSLSFIKKREFHSPNKVALLVSFVTSETRFCIFFCPLRSFRVLCFHFYFSRLRFIAQTRQPDGAVGATKVKVKMSEDHERSTYLSGESGRLRLRPHCSSLKLLCTGWFRDVSFIASYARFVLF